MSATCSNCGTKLGCSCQMKVASDGKSVCGTCITAYEVNLKNQKVKTDNTAPTNVNIFYKRPK